MDNADRWYNVNYDGYMWQPVTFFAAWNVVMAEGLETWLRGAVAEGPDDRCESCGHTRASHYPICRALDAAGDVCDCLDFRLSLGNHRTQ